ncbi:MAG TPA: alpha/beta hydrolase [Opitutaceae bacterium]
MVLALVLCMPGLAVEAAPASIPAGIPVEFWNLSTGSRIGYVRIPAPDRAGAPALVFVHGGPGACQVYSYSFARPWYERLAGHGFDVYLYDQIGSGFSARLRDPRQYTLDRHIADLEAIRKVIGSERLILIGESHGATLSAGYMAAHPDHVERAIFVAPGAIEPTEWKQIEFTYPAPGFLEWIRKTRGAEAARRHEGFLDLLRRDVLAAYRFAGDEEMDPLMDAFVRETILTTCVHDPARITERHFEVPGMGWWVGLMTSHDELEHNRAARSRLSQSRHPVLILRGDSDFVPWRAADEYAATFRNSKLIHIPAAGHFIWMDQPDRYCDEIEAFLLTLRRP